MQYETNWQRIALAYIGGSILAGILFIAGFAIFVSFDTTYTANSNLMWDRQELQAVLLLWVFVSAGWLLGQTMLVSLPWLFLHASGRRSWRYAVGIGITIVPLTTVFLGFNIFWGYLGFALWGGIMGWVIWRIAYFPARTPSS